MPQPEDAARQTQSDSRKTQDLAKPFSARWAKQQYDACKVSALRYAKTVLERPWWFKEKEPVARFTGWVAIYAFALATVAGLQTCILNNQLSEMRTENRPWIGIENIKAGALQSDSPLTVEITLRNTGKTPAFKTKTVF